MLWNSFSGAFFMINYSQFTHSLVIISFNYSNKINNTHKVFCKSFRNN